LVAKDNGSTALMILMVSLIVMIIGQLSSKYILGFLGISSIFIGIFLFLALKTDVIGSSRVHTWVSRIETLPILRKIQK
jgi:cell division protein FtsW